MEEEKEKLIKIIKDCNEPRELGLLEVLMTEIFEDLKRLKFGKPKTEKEVSSEILDRHLRTFKDFPNIKAGHIWNYVEYHLKIYTVKDLINTPPHKILKIRGMGKKKIEEIEEWLAKYDLKFIGT